MAAMLRPPLLDRAKSPSPLCPECARPIEVDQRCAWHATGALHVACSARLAAADPSNASWQRDLSVSHQKIGFSAEQRGESNEARINYMLSRDILLRLVAQDDSNATWRNDLGWVEERLTALTSCG